MRLHTCLRSVSSWACFGKKLRDGRPNTRCVNCWTAGLNVISLSGAEKNLGAAAARRSGPMAMPQTSPRCAVAGCFLCTPDDVPRLEQEAHVHPEAQMQAEDIPECCAACSQVVRAQPAQRNRVAQQRQAGRAGRRARAGPQAPAQPQPPCKEGCSSPPHRAAAGAASARQGRCRCVVARGRMACKHKMAQAHAPHWRGEAGDDGQWVWSILPPPPPVVDLAAAAPLMWQHTGCALWLCCTGCPYTSPRTHTAARGSTLSIGGRQLHDAWWKTRQGRHMAALEQPRGPATSLPHHHLPLQLPTWHTSILQCSSLQALQSRWKKRTLLPRAQTKTVTQPSLSLSQHPSAQHTMKTKNCCVGLGSSSSVARSDTSPGGDEFFSTAIVVTKSLALQAACRSARRRHHQ